jgi:hypothetical protein
LSKLQPDDRVRYYNAFCESLGLNPLTKPFDLITLNGKLVLYAKKDCTEQLRKINGVSVRELSASVQSDIYIVRVSVVDGNGREDISTGAVNIAGLKGDALANAIMKAETKAKRRATLSICGLGILDETEIETIPEPKKYAGESDGAKQPPAEPKTEAKPTTKKTNGNYANFEAHIQKCKTNADLEKAVKLAEAREWTPDECENIRALVLNRKSEIAAGGVQ